MFWNVGQYKPDDLDVITSESSALKMEQIECSETSANINQTPGKHPEVSTLDTEHGESLKSRTMDMLSFRIKT
jgi:hypothetical protein